MIAPVRDDDHGRPDAIRAVTEPARTVVLLRGDVDASLRDEASAAMAQAMGSSKPVLVDASGLRFIDSTGIAFLLQLTMAAREAAIPLSLWDPRRVVLDLLDTLGMAGEIPVAAEPDGPSGPAIQR